MERDPIYTFARLRKSRSPARNHHNTRKMFWTTDAGLPQNTVLAIAQTADGYLWLATEEGLVRF